MKEIKVNKINGTAIFLSFRWSPGKTNSHIWYVIRGREMMLPQIKDRPHFIINIPWIWRTWRFKSLTLCPGLMSSAIISSIIKKDNMDPQKMPDRILRSLHLSSSRWSKNGISKGLSPCSLMMLTVFVLTHVEIFYPYLFFG